MHLGLRRTLIVALLAVAAQTLIPGTARGSAANEAVIATPGTLFIEAEDFDFGKGKYIQDKPLGITGPYPGGAYQGLGNGLDGTEGDGSDFGIDYFEPAASNAQAIYRPTTGVEAGKLNGPAGFNRGTFNVEVNHVVGWNDAGDWYNYTRKFPEPEREYLVFGRLSSGGQPINAQLDVVTSGRGTANQQLTKIGEFKPERATAGWDTFETFPLLDAAGKPARVKIGGEKTVRFTTLPGNLDVDYLAFVPAGVPTVAAFDRTPFGLSAALKDSGAPENRSVDAASVKLTFDGSAATTKVSKAGDTTTITYDAPSILPAGSKHTFALEYKDSGGQTHTLSGSFTLARFGIVPASAKVAADTSKPGFLWRVHQNNANQQNTTAKTEAALSGALNLPNLADPSAQGGADGAGKVAAGAAGLIEFEVSKVINFSQQEGENNGNFRPDLQMPGIPGVEGSTDGIAAEIITFLELPKGLVRMGVNSDDGFKTTAGNVNDAFGAVFLGEFSGGRGAADTIFDFVVEEAGIYPFRTIWEEGGGGANVEWFTIKSDGTRVLVNDTANGGVKAYRAAAAGAQKPLVKAVFPSVPAIPAPSVKPEIGALILESGSVTVDQASVVLTVNGQPVKPTITKSGSEVKISFTPATDLAPASKVSASLTFKDSTGASRTDTWSWQTEITPKVFPAGTLFIEAEDVDFGKGKFVTDKKIGMNGAYEGGAYKDLGTAEDKGFDWNTNDNAGQAYRPETGIAAGKENGSAGSERGLFQVTTWWTLGWNDGNEWYNYTRDFPTPAKDYVVYGNLSSGGAAINIRVDQITAGQGQADAQQVKKTLGYFTPKRATPGWDNLEIFQLTDIDGNPITVNLGGRVTLRTTILPGSNSDQDYFAFVPSAPITPGPGTGDAPKLTASRTGNTLRIEWTGGGALESADVITGPWTAVAGASSPASVTISGNGKFYRVKR